MNIPSEAVLHCPPWVGVSFVGGAPAALPCWLMALYDSQYKKGPLGRSCRMCASPRRPGTSVVTEESIKAYGQEKPIQSHPDY